VNLNSWIAVRNIELMSYFARRRRGSKSADCFKFLYDIFYFGVSAG